MGFPSRISEVRISELPVTGGGPQRAFVKLAAMSELIEICSFSDAACFTAMVFIPTALLEIREATSTKLMFTAYDKNILNFTSKAWLPVPQ